MQLPRIRHGQKWNKQSTFFSQRSSIGGTISVMFKLVGDDDSENSCNLQVKKGLPSLGSHEKFFRSLVEIPERLHFKLYSPFAKRRDLKCSGHWNGNQNLQWSRSLSKWAFEKRLGPMMTIENVDFHSDDHSESQPAVCVHVVWTNIFNHINGYLCCSPPRAYISLVGMLVRVKFYWNPISFLFFCYGVPVEVKVETSKRFIRKCIWTQKRLFSDLSAPCHGPCGLLEDSDFFPRHIRTRPQRTQRSWSWAHWIWKKFLEMRAILGAWQQFWCNKLDYSIYDRV